MIRTAAILLAETVIRDAETNRISIINVHEQFRSPGFPVIISKFTVFALLEREADDPATPDCSIRIALDDEVVFEADVEVNFGDTILNRAVLDFQGFVLRRPGVLSVTVIVADHSTESYRIPVELAADGAQVVARRA